MNTLITEGGLKLRRVTIPVSGGTSEVDSSTSVTTEDLLVDLENKVQDFTNYRSSDGKDKFIEFITLVESFNLIMTNCFRGVVDILEQQINNMSLTSMGWLNLLRIIKFSCKVDLLHKHNNLNEQTLAELDKELKSLESYYNGISYLSSNSEVHNPEISKSRSQQVEELKREFSLGSVGLSISKSLTPTMFQHSELLCNLITSYFFNFNRR